MKYIPLLLILGTLATLAYRLFFRPEPDHWMEEWLEDYYPGDDKL